LTKVNIALYKVWVV